MRTLFLILSAWVIGLSSVGAADSPWSPFTPETDLGGSWVFRADPDLPNVLILGDSISIAYTREVRDLLAGTANVFRPMLPDRKRPVNCGETRMGLANIQTWLGEKRWDVIHFNWGLWDLCYRHPQAKTQGKRDKVNGTISVPLEEYGKNLEQLVERLKATGAKLVWASTTFVPEEEAGRFSGDDEKYNDVARAIMVRHGIAINDLHAMTKSFRSSYSAGPGDVHFTREGSGELARRVADIIAATLKEMR